MLKITLRVFLLLGLMAGFFSPAYGQMTGDVNKLKEDVHSPDLDRAVAAASALGSLTDNAQALDVLMGAMQLGTPPKLSLALLEAIGLHNNPTSLPILRRFLRHIRPEIREAALKAMANMDNPQIIPIVLSALQDSHPMVRAKAARILSERDVSQAEDALITILVKGDPTALDPLKKFGTAKTAKALIRQAGKLPDPLVISGLSALLLRKDFGPDPLRIDMLKTMSKIPGKEVEAIYKAYIKTIPKNDTRPSLKAARKLLMERQGQIEGEG